LHSPDNQLPGMSGIELLRRIVAATRDLTVIMITAYGDVPGCVGDEGGRFHFVQSPSTPRRFWPPSRKPCRTKMTLATLPEMKEFKAREPVFTQRSEVLTFLEGLLTKLIAHQLRISSRTAEHHRSVVIQKMVPQHSTHTHGFVARNLTGNERITQSVAAVARDLLPVSGRTGVVAPSGNYVASPTRHSRDEAMG
jgi:FixJ family two-component response regulator